MESRQNPSFNLNPFLKNTFLHTSPAGSFQPLPENFLSDANRDGVVTAPHIPDTDQMLASAHVNMQASVTPRYDKDTALQQGTLFPALNLPFKNILNIHGVVNTPLGELQAISFAVEELGLYLDTHPHDAEAMALRDSYVQLMKKGMEAYEKQFGPLDHHALMGSAGGGYPWVQDPWPWECNERGE